jgi:putative transposase
MKKARFFYLHEECNPGKIQKLNDLHSAYVEYVNICLEQMKNARKLDLKMCEFQNFFTKSGKLTSHLQRSARFQAIEIVSSWVASIYGRNLKKIFHEERSSSTINREQYKSLCIIGKYKVSSPSSNISQQDIDLFWKYLDATANFPIASDKLPIQLTELTCMLTRSKDTSIAPFMFRMSTLERRKRVWLPLMGNNHIDDPSDVAKSFQVRKDWRGRWRFETIEKKEHLFPTEYSRKVGLDVGLNVLAATSDGGVYGGKFKLEFKKKYERLLTLRKNRQRQGIFKDSNKLTQLERNLSGFIKTAVGTITNKLVESNPDTCFVIEDLDLRGSKGQKRFAYRALHKSLSQKAPIEEVNPAYTSQTCPSCGSIRRSNRSGIKFVCESCSRKSHADVVGSINLLGRSEEKQIKRDDSPFRVRGVLRRLYWIRRNPDQDCPLEFCKNEPSPSGRKLTTRKHVWQSFKNSNTVPSYSD